MQVEALPVADRIKALKSAADLAAACGRSRFLITRMHNDGRLPYVMVGGVRMSTLDQLWAAFEDEAAADMERRGIVRQQKQPKVDPSEREARKAAARASLGCGGTKK